MQDIFLDNDFDLGVSKEGDFKIGISDYQHQSLLLLLHKGELKQFPKTGAGVASYLMDERENDMLREARMQFEQDGIKVNGINFNEGKITWDASYSER